MQIPDRSARRGKGKRREAPTMIVFLFDRSVWPDALDTRGRRTHEKAGSARLDKEVSRTSPLIHFGRHYSSTEAAMEEVCARVGRMLAGPRPETPPSNSCNEDAWGKWMVKTHITVVNRSSAKVGCLVNTKNG